MHMVMHTSLQFRLRIIPITEISAEGVSNARGAAVSPLPADVLDTSPGSTVQLSPPITPQRSDRITAPVNIEVPSQTYRMYQRLAKR